MKKTFLSFISFLLCLYFTVMPSIATENAEVINAAAVNNEMPFDLDCKSAILMDSATGSVLYAKNPDEALPPASVTKIMTLLLTVEAIDSGKLHLEDKLTVSEYGASMGGSQVFLEVGEEMSVNDLLKCVVVSSANDAAVTLAEAVSGTETEFIEKMNVRAEELGMNNTVFENATGLDDTTVNHVTSARDIAIMSRELISHPIILEYSSIWMDSVRNGAFGLTNTNRLIRFYKGATGLKTGSTSKAKFCISATARRDNLHLIAVIMGAPTRDIRNECAKKLLDYGFANYAIYSGAEGKSENIKVISGMKDSCETVYPANSFLISKDDCEKITVEVIPNENIEAPVKIGDVCGRVVYKSGDRVLLEENLLCNENVEKATFFNLISEVFGYFLL